MGAPGSSENTVQSHVGRGGTVTLMVSPSTATPARRPGDSHVDLQGNEAQNEPKTNSTTDTEMYLLPFTAKRRGQKLAPLILPLLVIAFCLGICQQTSSAQQKSSPYTCSSSDFHSCWAWLTLASWPGRAEWSSPAVCSDQGYSCMTLDPGLNLLFP